MRSVVLFIFLFACSCAAFGQTVKGFVLNKETRMRLAKVYIFNERTDEGVINNSVGEFSIVAKPGDVLYAALEGYALDTVVYKGQSAIYFQLRPLAIQVRQVDILGKKLTPIERYLQNTKDYKYQLDRGKTRDILKLSPLGAGLSIDAIYNLLSREGKNARYLQKVLERDYKEAVIDYRFAPEFVSRVLQLKEPELSDFMLQYRPTYTFVLTASDYSFAVFLRNSYNSYKRAPDAFRLPELPKITP